jgi:hypothetical protein
MATYQRLRDTHSLSMYELTCTLATLEPPPLPMQQALGLLGCGRLNGVVKFFHAASERRARSMEATTWWSMTRSAWRSSGTAGG